MDQFQGGIPRGTIPERSIPGKFRRVPLPSDLGFPQIPELDPKYQSESLAAESADSIRKTARLKGSGSIEQKEKDKGNAAVAEGLSGIEKCQPAEIKAWVAWDYATKQAGEFKNLPAAYRWLEENFDPGADFVPHQLFNYELPSFETWSRQVRAVRKASSTQVNQPRAGRAYGKSIIREADR